MSGKKSLLFGIGINDSDTPIKCRKTNFDCPYYARWVQMLRRCYSSTFHIKNPTYKDCSVCNEWLLFSNFRSWMKVQDWENKELDKDIVEPNNKIYTPNKCAFIEKRLNGILYFSELSKGKYPKGVHFKKANNNFIASISINGKKLHIGSYETPELASEAYNSTKKNTLIKEASIHNDKKVSDGLIRHAMLL